MFSSWQIKSAVNHSFARTCHRKRVKPISNGWYAVGLLPIGGDQARGLKPSLTQYAIIVPHCKTPRGFRTDALDKKLVSELKTREQVIDQLKLQW